MGLEQLSGLGFDAGVILGIVIITRVITKMDSKNRLKRFYVLIPLLLGIVAAFFVTKPLEWQAVGKSAIMYAGLSAYLYSSRKLFDGIFGAKKTEGK